MSLNKIANQTIASIEKALGATLSEEQRKSIHRAVHDSLTRTVEHAGRQHRKAAESQLGADEDLAHKIADEIRRASIALKANLESLR